MSFKRIDNRIMMKMLESADNTKSRKMTMIWKMKRRRRRMDRDQRKKSDKIFRFGFK